MRIIRIYIKVVKKSSAPDASFHRKQRWCCQRIGVEWGNTENCGLNVSDGRERVIQSESYRTALRFCQQADEKGGRDKC